MREFEAGQERLRRTKDRIDFRTARAAEEMIANDMGADVVAADNEDIKGDFGAARRRDGDGTIGSRSRGATARWREATHRQEIQHSGTRPGHETEESR